MKKLQVFVSSKFSEFPQERAILKHEIEALPLLEPVLAEDWPPQAAAPKDVYVADVQRCYIYVGLFGCMYSEPTRVEYEVAGENPHREVLIYLRNCPGGSDSELKALIADILDTRVARKYSDPLELLPIVQADLQAALWRMVDLCLRAGKNQDQTGTRSVWTPSLASVGVPADPQSALELANDIEQGLQSRGIVRPAE